MNQMDITTEGGNTMKKSLCGVFVLIFVVIFFSIALANGSDVTPTTVDLTAASGTKAKGSIDAGDVTVWNDADNLYVSYTTSSPWCMLETHMQPATSVSAIPQTKGSPIPGQFQYQGVHSCITDITYTIPRTWDYGIQLIIAAQAKIINGSLTTDGAWGNGTRFSNKSWATYFTYTLQWPGPVCGNGICEDGESDKDCAVDCGCAAQDSCGGIAPGGCCCGDVEHCSIYDNPCSDICKVCGNLCS
jgi:hypothetical protein